MSEELRRNSHYIKPADCGPLTGWSRIELPGEPAALVVEPLASQLRELARTGRIDAARTLFQWFR